MSAREAVGTVLMAALYALIGAFVLGWRARQKLARRGERR